MTVLLPRAIHPRMGNAVSDAEETPLLEAPGFLLMNYGRRAPVSGRCSDTSPTARSSGGLRRQALA
jgi:hypothetical protein